MPALLLLLFLLGTASWGAQPAATVGVAELEDLKQYPVAQQAWNEISYGKALTDRTDLSYGPLKEFRQRFAQWVQSTRIDATAKAEFEKISRTLANPLLQQLAFEHLAHVLLGLKYDGKLEQCEPIEKLIYLVAYLCPSDPSRLIGIEKRWTPLLLIHLYDAYVYDRDHNRDMLPCTEALGDPTRTTLRDLIRRYSNNTQGVISVFGGGGGYGSGKNRYYSYTQSFMAPVWPEMVDPISAPTYERRRWDEIYGKGERIYFDLIKVHFNTYYLKNPPKKTKEPLASWANWSDDSPVMSEISTREIYKLWSKRVAPGAKSP